MHGTFNKKQIRVNYFKLKITMSKVTTSLLIYSRS
jgi:hypothetical protein